MLVLTSAGVLLLAARRAGAAMDQAPQMLSCDYHGEWRAYAATIHSHLVQAEAKSDPASSGTQSQRLGLPSVCSVEDIALFNWSDKVVFVSWPEGDAWDTFKKFQYKCNPDLAPTGNGEDDVGMEACVLPSGDTPCFYGVVSACACMAVMYASNQESMRELVGIARAGVRALQWMLHSGDKMLEFLDSSTWPFTVSDIVAILDAYGSSSVLLKPNASAGNLLAVLKETSLPWHKSGSSWQRLEKAAEESLSFIASWRWLPGFPQAKQCGDNAPSPVAKAAAGFRRSVRIWAFGTHCSVMAEPISIMANLLQDDFALSVVWRGAKDYCGYHSSSIGLAAHSDEGSVAREVYDRFHRTDSEPWTNGYSHRDSLVTPSDFEQEFRRALQAEGAAFTQADLGFCSEPALACFAMHELGNPLIGYFGVHIGFMLKGAEAQMHMYQRFRDELAVDPRSSFAVVAPYLSLQMYYHVPVQVPAVRPASLYTLPAIYTARDRHKVLLNKRPIAFWDLTILMDTFAKVNGGILDFVDATELYASGRHSFSDWAAHRAAVYFPYDWLQTMTFYDWLNMGLPTFVPDTPMYTLSRGTNSPDEWNATLWRIPSSIYPHHYSDWDDLPGRVFWWLLTDFCALPGVVRFASVAGLFEGLSSEDELWKTSGLLRQAHVERVAQSSYFWRGALVRGLQPQHSSDTAAGGAFAGPPETTLA